MPKNPLVSPFLKWVGGKRQLLTEIQAELPRQISRLRYYEPFIGGGAVFFSIQPRHAIINDYNSELVNAYQIIRDFPEELIADLMTHQNNSEYFYAIRNIDRDVDYSKVSIHLSEVFRYSNQVNSNNYNLFYIHEHRLIHIHYIDIKLFHNYFFF